MDSGQWTVDSFGIPFVKMLMIDNINISHRNVTISDLFIHSSRRDSLTVHCQLSTQSRHTPLPAGIGLFREGIVMRKRDIVMILAAIGVAIGVAVGIFITSTLETGSWGLSFRQEGAAPIGPAGADQLKKYDAAYLGDTSEKVIYLTFDAGYENGATERILDTLQKHNVKAAFFLVGNYIEKNADLVRRMAEEGHTVGNHTMHHPDMSGISDKQAFTRELQDLEALYREKTGKSLPKYYRPPQGIYSEENLKMAKELGYRTVFWSLAYVDWKNDSQPTKEEAFAKLLPRIHPGAVVLLHSTSETNAEILDELLTKWEEMGYRFGTLEELFGS